MNWANSLPGADAASGAACSFFQLCRTLRDPV